ncbi:HEAT repeat domain-containing protein [Archangium sp.]|uniref:HEAT repeat domain-containing protein n=1 Tax=Archangium sp. TaxID=1872627 RepID=UPI0039C8B0B7
MCGSTTREASWASRSPPGPPASWNASATFSATRLRWWWLDSPLTPGAPIRLGEADEARLPCFTEALSLVLHPQLSERLEALLSSPRPEVRATTARILGHRHETGAGPLLPLLEDAVPEVRAAAALAVSELGHSPALPVLERKLTEAPPEELDIWLLASLRLGSSRALQACRQAAQAAGPLVPRIPWLLGLAGAPQDFSSLRQLSRRPELVRTTLEAIGILGVPAAVPLLLEHLEHPQAEVREAAASALALMTGAGLTEKSHVFDEEAADEGAAEESAREVTRPSTDSAVWRAWWAEHRSRLEGKSRLRLGQHYTLDACIEELAHPRSPFDARARAALELDIRSGQPCGFQPDWPVHRQRQTIERWRSWTEHT